MYHQYQQQINVPSVFKNLVLFILLEFRLVNGTIIICIKLVEGPSECLFRVLICRTTQLCKLLQAQQMIFYNSLKKKLLKLTPKLLQMNHNIFRNLQSDFNKCFNNSFYMIALMTELYNFNIKFFYMIALLTELLQL